MPADVAVLSAVRTPYGRILGSLSDLTPVSLGAQAVSAAMKRAQVDAGEVERVVLGNAAAGALRGNPGAAAAREAGITTETLALTVRAGCASGLLAVTLAAEAIRSGACRLVLAGGFESASSAPHLATGLRRGLRLGGGLLLDAARHDGPAERAPGGAGRDLPPDADPGEALPDEIAPVSLPPGRKGSPERLERDEAPALGAHDAPPLADGGAALVLAPAAWAGSSGRSILARLEPVDPFAADVLRAAARIEADLPAEAAAELARRVPPGRRAPVNGGHGSLAGHAVGADGARLIVRLVHALRHAGGGRGLAVAAGAFGESAGILVEV